MPAKVAPQTHVTADQRSWWKSATTGNTPTFAGGILELRFCKSLEIQISETISRRTLGLTPDSLKMGPMINLLQWQGTVAISKGREKSRRLHEKHTFKVEGDQRYPRTGP